MTQNGWKDHWCARENHTNKSHLKCGTVCHSASNHFQINKNKTNIRIDHLCLFFEITEKKSNNQIEIIINFLKHFSWMHRLTHFFLNLLHFDPLLWCTRPILLIVFTIFFLTCKHLFWNMREDHRYRDGQKQFSDKKKKREKSQNACEKGENF